MSNIENYEKYLAKTKLLNLSQEFICNVDPSTDSVILIRYIDSKDRRTFEIPDFITGYKIQNLKGPFSYVKYLEKLIWNKEIKSIKALFAGFQGKYIDISKINHTEIESINQLFIQSYNIEHITINWDGSNKIKDMNSAFSDCYKLKEIDLSSINFSSVKDTNYMFNHCYNIQKVEFGDTEFRSLETAISMFCKCQNLEHILGNIDINKEKIKSIQKLFLDCNKIKDSVFVDKILSLIKNKASLKALNALNSKYFERNFTSLYNMTSHNVINTY